ncbi:FAD-dependent oxidoreductase [Glycomyces sp. NPDC021274]|uniref:NAD(P)/FAD-dependent oxidoreductase n=1 Tax=Glycomyces sp. NPDC021274 TaxID=3155120 RepID=UPI0033D09DE9
MPHRIVILGAGYAGMTAARRLGTLLRGEDAEIVLVNERTDFVERLRLHQVAAGQDLPRYELADLLRGTGVRLHCARVEAVDAGNRTVVADGERIGYDSLVLALGSAGVPLPGGAEAWSAASPAAAMRLRGRLARAVEGERVLVVGGGLTGLEVAAEVAEARPDLSVALATSGALGDRLVPGARAHLRRGFAALGVEVREGVRVRRLVEAGAVAEDGTSLGADIVIGATGFAPHPIAAHAGLEVDARGQVVVDAAMRSVSHREVFAIGDTAFAAGPGGRPLRMSCSSGMPTGWLAAGHLAAAVAGRRPPALRVRYFHQAISLGRRNAVVQFVTADDRPRRGYLTGAAAARYKEALCRIAVWSFARDLPAGRPGRVAVAA